MTSVLPESHRDLMDKPVVVSIVTLDEKQQPHAVPIWRKVDEGGHILMSSDKSSRKVRNIRANSQVAVLTIDPANPYRYLEVGGTAEIVETGARELLDELARFYSDKPAYFGYWEPIESADSYDGVVIKITPNRFVKG
jgi:PPOX class probable F420-dependent enzyme